MYKVSLCPTNLMQNRFSVEHHIHSIPLSPLSILCSGDSPVDSVLGEGSEKYLEKLNTGGEDPLGMQVTTIGLQACTNTLCISLTFGRQIRMYASLCTFVDPDYTQYVSLYFWEACICILYVVDLRFHCI